MQTSARISSTAEDTRGRIIAAAKAIYEQNGTRGTTTREVAERAGVNEATVFRHFGNKHALLNAMRESSCALATFESVLATLGGDLSEDLRKLATALAQRMFEQRAMMCISLAEDAREASIPEWRGPLELMQMLERYFAEQIALGYIHGEPAPLAMFFMSMCFAYVIGRRVWNSFEIKTRDIDFMVNIFLNGAR